VKGMLLWRKTAMTTKVTSPNEHASLGVREFGMELAGSF
jgi:hypothetical protein